MVSALSERGGRRPALAGWRVAGTALVVLVIALLFTFRDTAASAISIWINTEAFKHCFLILPISAYLVWRRRSVFGEVPPRPTMAGWLVVALFTLLWLAGALADINLFQHVGLVGILQGTILSVVGFSAYRRLLFPLIYLWLLVPFGIEILPLLQDLAAWQVEWLLFLTNITVFRDGLLIEVPSGRYYIAPGCGGFNFVAASIALAPLYAYLVYEKTAKRVAAVGIMVTLSVVGNILRIWAIIVIGHITDHQIPIASNHVTFGWGVFVLILILAGWFGLRFADTDVKAFPDPSFREETSSGTGGTGRRNLAIIATGTVAGFVAVAMGPGVASPLTRDPGAVDVEIAKLQTPEGWREELPSPGWEPRFQGSHGKIYQRFLSSGAAVDIAIGYFWRQGQGRELVGSGIDLKGPGWRILSRGAGRAVVGGRPVDIRVTRMLGRGAVRIVWSFYWVDGEFRGDPPTVKFLSLKAKILPQDRRSAVIAVSTIDTPGSKEAERALRDFLGGLGDLQRVLNGAERVPAADSSRS